jgi:hypothetical protein
MTLPINWATGNTYQATDMNTLDAVVNSHSNALPAALVGTAAGVRTTDQATSGTGQVQVASYTIGASKLAAGMAFRVTVFGQQSTTSGVLTWNLRVGTANTSADTLICASTSNVAASGGCRYEALLTCRSTGASGTVFAASVGQGSTATGVSTATATQTVNTTVQQYLTVGVAAGAGTHTVRTAVISQVV